MTSNPKNAANGKKERLLKREFVKITSLSYTSLFLIWAGMAVGFGFAYFILSSLPDMAHHGPTQLESMSTAGRFWNSLYYSVITATSTGYGDITPQGFSKFLASIQSMFALFVFAIFVTKLVSHRQELALREVHKLTFEDIYHNTREDLFIIRKDLDMIIEEANETKALSQESWENLTSAYQQAQTLIAEIPDFYDVGSHLYTIDPKREELLLESVHRTLHRINKTLDTLSKCGIEWISHENSMKELRELVQIIDHTTPLWRSHSPYEKEEAFQCVMNLGADIHKRAEGALP